MTVAGCVALSVFLVSPALCLSNLQKTPTPAPTPKIQIPIFPIPLPTAKPAPTHPVTPAPHPIISKPWPQPKADDGPALTTSWVLAVAALITAIGTLIAALRRTRPKE